MVATQNIDTLGPIWTFSLKGVLTFMARGLDMNGCMFSYFEMTALLHCYTSCTLTTLHCSKVSFLQYCHMKRYNQIFTKMWGVYSLLWDTVSVYISVCLSICLSICLSVYLSTYICTIYTFHLFIHDFFNHNQTKKVWLYYHILNKKWVLQIQLFIVHLKISVKYNANINILFSSFLFLLFFHCFQC